MSYPEFINTTELKALASRPAPSNEEINAILAKSLKLKGLSTEEAAALLAVRDESQIHKIMEAAETAKETIYGKRMVMFAPLYSGNHCSNNCLYCGFRKDNKDIARRKLEQDEIAQQTRMLLKEGHKRLLLLSGESGHYPLEYLKESLKTIYAVKEEGASIRRVNVEIAPLTDRSVQRAERVQHRDIHLFSGNL